MKSVEDDAMMLEKSWTNTKKNYREIGNNKDLKNLMTCSQKWRKQPSNYANLGTKEGMRFILGHWEIC